MRHFLIIALLSIISIGAQAGEFDQRRDELIIEATVRSIDQAIEESGPLAVAPVLKQQMDQLGVCIGLAKVFGLIKPSIKDTEWYISDDYQRGIFLALEDGIAGFGRSAFKENYSQYEKFFARHRVLYASAVVQQEGDGRDLEQFVKAMTTNDKSFYNTLYYVFVTVPDEEEQTKWLDGCRMIADNFRGADIFFENRAREELI